MFVKRKTAWLALGVVISLIIIFAGNQVLPARAQEKSTMRKTTMTMSVTENDWWLARYSDNRVACEVAVAHDGNPTPQEVFDQCGNSIYNEWIASKTCESLGEGGSSATCPGFYLLRIGSHTEEKVIKVDLPLPSVMVSLVGCESASANSPCTGKPALKF